MPNRITVIGGPVGAEGHERRVAQAHVAGADDQMQRGRGDRGQADQDADVVQELVLGEPRPAQQRMTAPIIQASRCGVVIDGSSQVSGVPRMPQGRTISSTITTPNDRKAEAAAP